MIFEIVGAAANVAKNYTLDSGALGWSRPASRNRGWTEEQSN